ncbi:hypothetical protein lerEdw1_020697 [Lerista edwardsae]|nr:hypothetical protein lerEdw1_020697 [Lerista edwardsae]
MDEEGGYMSLHFQPRKEQQREKPASEVQEIVLRRHPNHRLLDAAACAAILLLIGFLVALGVWESAGTCRLCPQNWSLYDDKCYWISKERQTWRKSKEDCRAKRSQLLVIQTREEVAFIQSITEGAQLLWIGLEATPPKKTWTWEDGSPLDDERFQELGPAKANFCGRLNGNQLSVEGCNTISMWICETKAFRI